jgi:hypothetical protein
MWKVKINTFFLALTCLFCSKGFTQFNEAEPVGTATGANFADTVSYRPFVIADIIITGNKRRGHISSKRIVVSPGRLSKPSGTGKKIRTIEGTLVEPGSLSRSSHLLTEIPGL